MYYFLAWTNRSSLNFVTSQQLHVLLKWQLSRDDTVSDARDDRNSVFIHRTRLNALSLSALEVGSESKFNARAERLYSIYVHPS